MYKVTAFPQSKSEVKIFPTSTAQTQDITTNTHLFLQSPFSILKIISAFVAFYLLQSTVCCLVPCSCETDSCLTNEELVLHIRQR